MGSEHRHHPPHRRGPAGKGCGQAGGSGEGPEGSGYLCSAETFMSPVVKNKTSCRDNHAGNDREVRTRTRAAWNGRQSSAPAARESWPSKEIGGAAGGRAGVRVGGWLWARGRGTGRALSVAPRPCLFHSGSPRADAGLGAGKPERGSQRRPGGEGGAGPVAGSPGLLWLGPRAPP